MMNKIDNVISKLENEKARSAWGRGVNVYALELLEDLHEAVKDGWVTAEQLTTRQGLKRILLNGAADWQEYSEGGSALIYNCDIAKRLCTPSELKKKRGGELPPNSREQWLDTQARALFQACEKICRIWAE